VYLDVTIGLNSLQSYPLSAIIGSDSLVTMTILENGNPIDDISRVEWDGVDPTENPFPIGEDNRGGFENKTLFIRSSATEGVNDYEAIITSESGLTSTINFRITTMIPGTPVVANMGVIWNRSGQNNGSFDFEAGANVPSNNADRDLQDQGNVSDTDQTWLRQIAAVNGATLRSIVANQGGAPDGWTFGDVTTKEEIASLYEQANEYDGSAISENESFIISTSEGNLYLFSISDIEETPLDNFDQYMFDIKN